MLEELASALDVLAATELDSVTDGELHDAVVAAERLSSEFAAQRARLIQAWDGRRVWASDGSKSPVARLARDCRWLPMCRGLRCSGRGVAVDAGHGGGVRRR